MNLNELTSIIGSIGFPIVACCAMGWYINSTMQKFTDVMQKNTTALEKLISTLGRSEKDENS